jgi:hypothetical protein
MDKRTGPTPDAGQRANYTILRSLDQGASWHFLKVSAGTNMVMAILLLPLSCDSDYCSRLANEIRGGTWSVDFTGLAQILGQLQAVHRDFKSKHWAILQLLGQPCIFYAVQVVFKGGSGYSDMHLLPTPPGEAGDLIGVAFQKCDDVHQRQTSGMSMGWAVVRVPPPARSGPSPGDGAGSGTAHTKVITMP